MKTILYVVCLALALVGVAAAKEKPLADDALTVIKPHLKTWQPDAVTLSDETLTIVLPQDRITEAMYAAVIGNGVCASVHLGEQRWDGVGEVTLLNRHSKQGYVFEGGYPECEEMGELTRDKTELWLLGKTHLF